MAKRGELSAGGQLLQGLLFPQGGFAVDVLECGRREYEKSAIDPVAVAARLLLEAPCAFPLQVKAAETAGRPHRRHCRLAAFLGMKREQGADVDIGDSVTVGHAEVFIFDKAANPLQPPPSLRIFTSIHQGDVPWLELILMQVDTVVRQIDGDIGGVQREVGKVLLHHIALVAEADHEIGDAEVGVTLHDVPENRLAANFHHRLWTEHGFFRQTRTETAGEDHCFHVFGRRVGQRRTSGKC